MPQIDPVILQLRAEVQQYRNEVKSVTVLVEGQLGRQEAAVQRLENQIRASSDRIGGTFRTLAGSIGAAFSAQQVGELVDSYTRFTNQLKVAGLEGQQLANVQERLFGIAQQYGVQLEAVAQLYGRSSASAKELGLTQKEQVTITEATAAALKVSGTSATEASGALLQLSQALGGSKIQAEEYNSLIDELRPLLQAVAAGSDKWGGSVAKLTADVKKSNVTTREFVQALLKGAPTVIKQAESATLTLSGAFTKLTNALTIYVGQSAQANGATAAIAGGLDLLSRNLDRVSDALAVVAIVMLGRFTGALATGTVAMVANAAAAAGATTAIGTMGAVAASAARSLVAAFGGPVGLAVSALAAYLYLVYENSGLAAQQARITAQANEKLGDSSQKAADAIDKLANAHGKAREEARKEVEQLKKLTEQRLKDAQAALLQAQAEFARAKATAKTDAAFSGAPIGSAGAAMYSQADNSRAQAEKALEGVTAQEKVVGALFQQLQNYKAALAAPEKKLSPVDDGKKKKKDTFSDVDQYDRELASLRQDRLRSEEQLATDANNQAKFRHEQVNADVEAYRKSLEDRLNSETLTKTQKARIVEQNKTLLAQKEANAQLDHALINRELDDRLISESADIERSRVDAQRDLLDTALEMARTEQDRRRIQLQILDAETEAKRIALQQVLDSRNSTDAQKEVARQDLAALPGQRNARARSIERQTQGPLDAYIDKLPKTAAEIDERVQTYVVDELDSVTKGISDAISSKLGVKDPLLSGLLDLFIEQVLIKPIAEALSSARGAGAGGGLSGLLNSIGSGLGSIFGKKDFASGIGGDVLGLAGIFGRASGGYVGPGQTVRVNEQRGGVELLRMGSQGGTIVPLGRTDAARPRAAAQTIVNAPQFNLKGAVVTSDLLRQMQQISNDSAKQYAAAMGQQVLRAVPQRMQGYQTDGT